MDSEKRNKLILIVVAVFGVGAGSYWLLGRGSNAERPAALVEGDAGRKPRPATEAPLPPRKPAPAIPSEVGATGGQRKPPPEPEYTNTNSKK